MLWAAYEELCELGANVDASRFFGPSTYSANGMTISPCSILSILDAVPYGLLFVAWADRSDESSKALEFGENEGDTDDNNSNNATSDLPFDDAFATPEPRPLIEVSTPKVALDAAAPRLTTTKPPSHSSYKTPKVSSGNPAEGMKKSRVAGVAGGGTPNPRARKTYRRPATEDDETDHRNARLSFSSVTSADDTPVRERCFVDEVSWEVCKSNCALCCRTIPSPWHRTLPSPLSRQDCSTVMIHQRNPIRLREEGKRAQTQATGTRYASPQVQPIG